MALASKGRGAQAWRPSGVWNVQQNDVWSDMTEAVFFILMFVLALCLGLILLAEWVTGIAAFGVWFAIMVIATIMQIRRRRLVAARRAKQASIDLE